ncbi:hypothetical protein MKW92_011426, partial [Papaver armeniacum]
MICSICSTYRVTPSNCILNKDANFTQNTGLRDGVAVCNSCYAEVNNVMTYINKDIYYGS